MKLFRPAFEKDPRWQLSNWRALNPERSRHYVAVAALKKMWDEVGKAALAELIKLQPGPGGDAFNIDHMAGEIRWRIKSFNLGAEVKAVTALLSIAENDEYRAIAKEIEPLIESARALDQAEEKARIDRQRKEASLRDAREAAKQRALESFESDPAVVAAKQELAEAQAVAGEL
jgi:DNA-binding helix-hairpin-helix protein with protein kinase domain